MPPDASAADDEDDDYMNMTFTETSSQPTTSLARKQAAARSAAERGRPKSKKELEAEREKKLRADLSKNLDPTNRGAKMLAKLGFKGGALGAAGNENARTEPIAVSMKDDRGGVGMENEKKRKIREILEAEAGKEKRIKAEAGEYVDRVRREKEEKRNEGMWWGAMRVAEGLDEERDEGKGVGAADTNVLWRVLARDRIQKEREKKARREYMDRFSRQLPEVAEDEEDADDKIAMGTEIEEVEEEDEELDEYLALDPAEKLLRVVQYLRNTYNYCFWCKYRYPDDEMEGCPGLTEEDHD